MKKFVSIIAICIVTLFLELKALGTMCWTFARKVVNTFARLTLLEAYRASTQDEVFAEKWEAILNEAKAIGESCATGKCVMYGGWLGQLLVAIAIIVIAVVALATMAILFDAIEKALKKWARDSLRKKQMQQNSRRNRK